MSNRIRCRIQCILQAGTEYSLIKLTCLTGKEEGTKLSREIFVSVYKNHEFVCGGIFVSDKHILILSLCTFGTPSSIFLIKSHTVEPISIEKIVYQDEIGSSIGLIIVSNFTYNLRL